MSKEETIILQDFIFNDKVQNILSEINDNVMDFNILEITGMGTQEIKHSNILGWLFDDSEHNLEYQILNNFLKRVIKEKGNCNDGLQSYLYLSNKKRDISVYREKDNIDLLIVDEANKIVISIENKIYANERIEGEDGGQLQKYENILNEKYHNYDKYYIFLTIDFEYPSEENEHWLRANYQIIVDTLEEILKIKETTTKTKIVLESYIDLLKRNGIVGKKELQQLCEKIWNNKQYANAIDILMDYRITPIKKIYDMLKDELPFYSDSNCLALDGIKKLYDIADKNEEEEWVFDIMLNYYGGKD